jgi:hypothetical protein
MNLSRLAASTPDIYAMLQQIGLQRRRTRAARAASRAGWVGRGVAVGSGLALLLAPRSGAATRERLGEQARRARDYVAPQDETTPSHLGPHA